MFKEGHTIIFEMPPFCSGDYEAKIHNDELGLYINSEDNYFPTFDGKYWSGGARDWQVVKK